MPKIGEQNTRRQVPLLTRRRGLGKGSVCRISAAAPGFRPGRYAMFVPRGPRSFCALLFMLLVVLVGVPLCFSLDCEPTR